VLGLLVEENYVLAFFGKLARGDEPSEARANDYYVRFARTTGRSADIRSLEK
jgi:hypothetical protein